MASKFFIKINKENETLYQKVKENICESKRTFFFSEKEDGDFSILFGEGLQNDRQYLYEVPAYSEIITMIEAAKDGSGGVYTELRDGSGFESIRSFGDLQKKLVTDIAALKDLNTPMHTEGSVVLDVYFPLGNEADVYATVGEDLCEELGITSDNMFCQLDEEESNGLTQHVVTISKWNKITPADVEKMETLIAAVNARVAVLDGKATYLIEPQLQDMEDFDILAGDTNGAEYISEDGSQMLEIHFSTTGIQDVKFTIYQ